MSMSHTRIYSRLSETYCPISRILEVISLLSNAMPKTYHDMCCLGRCHGRINFPLIKKAACDKYFFVG